ncbi:hypothetical protein BJ997_003710 [Cryobacterium roopkundense]|uniref:Uncharacterized protein n=1 Tax=Cryobacterium roopkundense TaxID=1001240 RepID=A0A7W9E4X6_9MICO|nr:hypothetical protein [Cryobacterium roopkundense]
MQPIAARTWVRGLLLCEQVTCANFCHWASVQFVSAIAGAAAPIDMPTARAPASATAVNFFRIVSFMPGTYGDAIRLSTSNIRLV